MENGLGLNICRYIELVLREADCKKANEKELKKNATKVSLIITLDIEIEQSKYMEETNTNNY